MSPVQVSVVVGSYNRKPFLRHTIETIRRSQVDFKIEIIVIDGGSTDGTIHWLSRQKDVVTIIQHNRGQWNGRPVERRSWGYFMNLGFKAAQGELVLMLSDDCLLHSDALRLGVRFYRELRAQGRPVGAVPFYWRNWPEMKSYWIGTIHGGYSYVNHGLYLREALDRVGYVDETNFLFYYADIDLCLKIIHAGYEVVPCRKSFVEHYSHANQAARISNSLSGQRDREAFFAKWHEMFSERVDELGSWEHIEGPPEGDILANRHWAQLHSIHSIRSLPGKAALSLAVRLRGGIRDIFGR